VADLEHAGRGLLRRGADRGHLSVWTAGHHEQRSRVAVHILCLDRPPEAPGRPHIHGWEGSLPGQHLHRAPVAHSRIRVRLPARLRDRVTGPRGCPDMDGILQSPTPAQSPWRTTTSSDLLAENRSNATPSARADQSSKSARYCPRNGSTSVVVGPVFQWSCHHASRCVSRTT
jgi:hypothetical protein